MEKSQQTPVWICDHHLPIADLDCSGSVPDILWHCHDHGTRCGRALDDGLQFDDFDLKIDPAPVGPLEGSRSKSTTRGARRLQHQFGPTAFQVDELLVFSSVAHRKAAHGDVELDCRRKVAHIQFGNQHQSRSLASRVMIVVVHSGGAGRAASPVICCLAHHVRNLARYSYHPMSRPAFDQLHHAVLQIEYDGGPYKGWHRQPTGVRTVEGDLLAAFQRLGCTVEKLQCAGRTDAGVHAVGQVADVIYRGGVGIERLARALAKPLPDHVAVRAATPAPVGFDARADATSRRYEYRVLNQPIISPTRAGRVLFHPRLLDRALLDAAAERLLGEHDFTAFTPRQSQHVYFRRTIDRSHWFERGDELIYEIRGNAFLRHMVRVILGVQLAIARGERTVADLDRLLAGAERSDAEKTVPAHALCFMEVTWEPIDGLPLPLKWRAARA
ncbi:MAG: tRNA pseudouridine synthase [Thermoleophilia bacterium]|nr:tRNA pseudouridine synthase [Thermoleophilia bacterium]